MLTVSMLVIVAAAMSALTLFLTTRVYPS